MVAVYWGQLEIVKELENVEGIDFNTKNIDDKTLIEIARMRTGCCHSPGTTVVFEYLLNRRSY